MAGKTLPQPSKHDFKDPFTAGQMVGMLVVLTFIEKNNGIPAKVLEELKRVAASNAQEYLDRPTEDVYLMVDRLVKELG